MAQARLRIRLVTGTGESGVEKREQARTVTVGAGDEFAVIDVHMPDGPLDIKASLLDAEGRELRGEYDVDVERLAGT